MRISQLKLNNYRNYANAFAKFNPRFNLIVGQNGMGKTNLVDAIYFLGLTKSNFSSQEKHIIRNGESFMRLAAEFNHITRNKQHHLVVKLRPGKKQIEFDHQVYSRLSEHIGKIPIVFIAPKDVHSLLEASKERRKFMNQTLAQSDPEYLISITKYNRLLKQRNGYLKSHDRPQVDEIFLDALSKGMEAPANYVFEARKSFISKINDLTRRQYEIISEGREQLSLAYKSQLETDSIHNLHKTSLEKDLILKRTTSGIHKDDLLIELDESPLKYFASQGQLKSVIFALKFSQFVYLKETLKNRPILILDDVFDKLDYLRVEQLIHILCKDNFGQIFITDTDQDRIAKILTKKNQKFTKLIIQKGVLVNHEEEE